MAVTPAQAVAYVRTPQGQKMFRYSMASVVALFTSVICLAIFELLGWGAVLSSTLATAIAAVPSYEMNRKWAWGKTGRGHLWRELVPFWVIALIGWAFSTYSVRLAESRLHHVAHLEKAGIIVAVYVAAYGVLWVGKFIIFNRILFVHHGAKAEVAG